MFLWFVKVILYLATLFTVLTLPRIVLYKMWFLSTHSSSSAARPRYNISYTPYFTTRNLKHGSNVGHDYDQPVAGRVVWSYFLRVTWIHRLPERCWIVGSGWSSSECCFFFRSYNNNNNNKTHTHTHTHTKVYDRNSAEKQYRTVTDWHAPRKSFLINANLQECW